MAGSDDAHLQAALEAVTTERASAEGDGSGGFRSHDDLMALLADAGRAEEIPTDDGRGITVGDARWCPRQESNRFGVV